MQYLYSKLRVIHRDVKPSNILISRTGKVKMCDFGISGYLVDSVAKTIDAGCKPYMAVKYIINISSHKVIFKTSDFTNVKYFYSLKESIRLVTLPIMILGQMFGV